MEPSALFAETHAPLVQRYLANLMSLYSADPELAARVDALPFSSLPTLEPTRDGNFTARVTGDNGQSIYLHSRYRPEEEARALIEAQTKAKNAFKPEAVSDEPLEEEEDDEELSNPCFLVCGLGLGYHLAELERRYHRPLVVVAEDDLRLIKAALCTVDVAKPIRDRRVAFLPAADRATMHSRLRSAITQLMLGMKFINLPHTLRYHAAFFAQVRALMKDFVAYSHVQMVSLLRHARITCRNVAFNLPTYVREPGIEVLRGRGRGYPAILIAAGPSLARNIDQLAQWHTRAVFIAVQTVFKQLVARGVPPHFVTSLDYHEISAQFFHGVKDFGQTTLVAEPKAAWRVVDTFKGRTHVLHSPFADDLLRELAPARDGLPSGSTVAHLSFYLAEYLGCDPIILVGQDLSFTEGMYYPAGMQIERIWWPEMGRFQTIEMKQWERIVRSRSGLRRVQDIHGRDTYTDEQLFTYAEQFMSDFAQSGAKVVHATEGGMLFEGTEIMTLREAGERFCQREMPEGLFDIPAGEMPAPQQGEILAALEARLRETQEIREIAMETEGLLEKLAELVEKPKEFNRLVAQVDELRVRMHRHRETYELVVQVSQAAELRRVQADRAIRDEDDETPASARRRLKRDREYVGAFIDGCDYLMEMLPKVIQRVREQLA